MVGAERLLPDRQRAPIQPLRLRVLALGVIHVGQVVEGPRAVDAIPAIACFTYANSLLAEPLRLRVATRLAMLLELFVNFVQVLSLRRRPKQRSSRHRERKDRGKPAQTTPADLGVSDYFPHCHVRLPRKGDPPTPTPA